MPRPNPRVIILLVLAGVLAFVVLPILLTDQPGTVATGGDIVSKTFSGVSVDSEAVYDVQLLEGSDAAHESTHMFDALDGLEGVSAAALDTKSLKLAVSYSSATTTEGPIRARLLAAGYLRPTADEAEPAVLDAGGKVQRIAVVDDHGFSPAYIRARAGIPLEIEFGPGTECRVTVVFPELKITSDISKGGVVKLPALEPGTYTIACGGNAPEGAIIVE